MPCQGYHNDDLASDFPDWPAQKIYDKTGIRCRHIAASDECASDLAVEAAQRLFAHGLVKPEDIDFVIFCTQEPDHFLPSTACLIQNRLGIPQTAGALDINLGCSGFVYGLGLAKGLIETSQATHVLLLTADTYNKVINPLDKGCRVLFGDGAAATLVESLPQEGIDSSCLDHFVYGTDGSGAGNLIVKKGAFRNPLQMTQGQVDSGNYLYMNGPEILNFSIREVPRAVNTLFTKAQLTLDDVDYFVFHQANKFMVEHLRKKLGIREDRCVLAVEDTGNTVSSTIPIAICKTFRELRTELRVGQRIVCVGFGVGLSWGACVLYVTQQLLDSMAIQS